MTKQVRNANDPMTKNRISRFGLADLVIRICLVIGYWSLVIGLFGCQRKTAAPSKNNQVQVVVETPAESPPLFSGWPKPKVALVLTGQQMGYLEPCGCTGLENQKGGLARRHTLIRELSEQR